MAARELTGDYNYIERTGIFQYVLNYIIPVRSLFDINMFRLINKLSVTQFLEYFFAVGETEIVPRFDTDTLKCNVDASIEVFNGKFASLERELAKHLDGM